jgi:hypothetical protein
MEFADLKPGDEITVRLDPVIQAVFFPPSRL